MKQLGPYQLQEVLGQGGMATVYRAYQTTLEREVAIKVIASSYTANPAFVQRFQREALATARLNHPNILTIYDFGQDPASGEYYIVSELVQGKTLRDRLGQPFALETASQLLQQLADALDHAHEMGIIHRDVKPGNILLDRRGRPILGDFGIALLMEGASELTASGLGVGTPAYMSPEQALGDGVDGRSDQYSLGIVLYEMLTGSTPFRASTPVAMVMAHATRPLPDPRRANPALPIEAVEVLNRALAKDPAQRYPTTGQFAQAFREAIKIPASDQPFRDSPPSASEVTPTIPISDSAGRYFFPNNTPPSPSQNFAQSGQPESTNLAVPAGWPTIQPQQNQEVKKENQEVTRAAWQGPATPPAPTLPILADRTNQKARSNRGALVALGLVALVSVIGVTLTLTLLLNQGKTGQSASAGQASLAATATANPSSGGTSSAVAGAGSNSPCATSQPTLQFTRLAEAKAGAKQGQLNLLVLETACKAAKGGEVSVKIYRENDPDTVVTSQCCANQLSFALAPGAYRSVISYASGIEERGPAIEIKEGQEAFQSINLQLGQAQLELLESNSKSAKGGDVSVKVYHEGDRNTPVTTACCNNKLTFYLKAGRYELVTSYADGVELDSNPFEIKDGETFSQTLNFGVGRLQLTLLESEGKSARADAITVKAFKPGDYNTPVTTVCCSNQPELVLRPGSYEVIAVYADGVQAPALPVQISEGQTGKQTINFHAGQASLEIMRADGRTVNGSDISVQIYKQADPNTVVTSGCCATKLSFSLAPGRYRVAITVDNITKKPYELEIEVKEGQLTSQTVRV